MSNQYTALTMDSSPESVNSEKFVDDRHHRRKYSRPFVFAARKTSRRNVWVLTLALVGLLLIFLRGSSSVQRRQPVKPALIDVSNIQLPFRHDQFSVGVDKTSSALSNSAISNRTLGFEKIYVLNMPHRRDKKAELTILAYQYNLDLTFIDGIYAKEIRPDLEKDPLRQGQYGVSEAHGHLWQRIIDDGVSTALIMEDDVDFSVFIREQLQLIREPLAMLTSKLDGRPAYNDPNDPYNSAHWDQLWFGEENEWYWKPENLPENMTEHVPMISFNDPYRSREMKIDYEIMFKAYGLEMHNQDDTHASERIRMVQASRNSWALGAYAFSRKGVHKALYMNSHKHWVQHIDFDLMQTARIGAMRDFTVVPPLFQQRKPIEGEDSERTQEFGGGKVIGGKLGRTNSIANTARENLEDDIVKFDRPVFFNP